MKHHITDLVRALVTVMLTVSVVACSEPGNTKTESQNAGQNSAVATGGPDALRDVEDILKEAATKYREAQQLDHAWKATPKHMEAARKALRAEDQKLARTAAKRALHTANASVAQAMRGRDDWRNNVVK